MHQYGRNKALLSNHTGQTCITSQKNANILTIFLQFFCRKVLHLGQQRLYMLPFFHYLPGACFILHCLFMLFTEAYMVSLRPFVGIAKAPFWILDGEKKCIRNLICFFVHQCSWPCHSFWRATTQSTCNLTNAKTCAPPYDGKENWN